MNFFKKNKKTLLATAVIFICIVLAVCSVFMLGNFSDEMKSQAKMKVELNTLKIAHEFSNNIKTYQNRVIIASEVVRTQGREDFFEAVYRLAQDKEVYGDIVFARYFRNGIVYHDGVPYENEDQAVLKLLGSEQVTTSAPFFDTSLSMYLVASYAPIYDCEYADGIALYYPVRELTTYSADIENEIIDTSDVLVFCDKSGEIYNTLHGAGVLEHSNIVDTLGEKVSAETKTEVKILFTSGESAIFDDDVLGVTYITSVTNIATDSNQYFVVCLYQAEKAYDSGYLFVDGILGTLLVFFVVLIGFSVFSIVQQRKITKTISEIGTTNEKYDCPTALAFERDGAAILDRNKATQFVVIEAEIKHFKYLSENFTAADIDGIISYIILIFKKAMQIDELYAYSDNGVFLLLLHHNDIENILGRLKIMNVLAGKYKGASSDKPYSIQISFGIYEVNREAEHTVQTMIEFADEANHSKEEQENNLYRFYSEELHTAKIEESNIELKMESALVNKEFRIFYQPKYNCARNTIDGSEALVRWYNPEKDIYNPPAVFMPLFEANGFINKLDRYVYETVCQYVADCFERNQRVYPVSVNVSRVTASQPDFVDYYVAIKNKYGIRNRFITIEFTESFAFEDYEILSNIIDRLHKNGFYCSVDDFGVGYSSYNVLKQLAMDEIKLDMFFLKKGQSVERDDKIIASICNVAKDLGMKVTQEGVETAEEFARMKAIGIDVIQGYFYSRPLPLSDFIRFNEEGGTRMSEKTES